MKQFPIALQLYTVRDQMEADFVGTLRAVKEMGYDGVEFAGLFGRSAAEVKALCEEIGLVPVSAHVPYVDLIGDPTILAVYKELGCRYVVIPYLAPENLPGQPGFATFLPAVKDLIARAAAMGLKVGYHNHDFEFTDVDGEMAIDIMYREIPELLPQFDTCWVQMAGESAPAYIRRYAGRQEIVHLKDYAGVRTEHMYGLIGLDDGVKESSPVFELRPVGKGMQDFPAILAACADVGMQWVIVEQDEPTMGLSRMECARVSIEYLHSL
ncbi:MAG: sugar phosphate isomerase/epimerase [Clostridia bacterium]|nr:sugar phosphate isomerase/epimerase [Clostridia bacterium]